MTCGYTLEGLPSPGQCPECGRGFDLADASTFLDHAPFVGWRFWLPGLILAVAIGLGIMLTSVFVFGAWGWSVWVAAPLMGAAIIGYGCRVKRWILPLLGIVLGGCMIFGLISASLAGVYCGLILGAIVFVPILIGILLGFSLRESLKRRGFSQASYFPILAIAAVGLACGVADRATAHRRAAESISTQAIINAPASACFDSIMFYEEVRHRPPLILRIGLAHPLRTIGSSRSVGDTKTCIYNKGRITKRTTAVVQDRLLRFDVTEQDIGYERDVRLIDGAFEFEALGPDRTRVTLTTRYEPLLTPRLIWRWGERIAVHTLHAHVLEGMRREAGATFKSAPAHAAAAP